MQAWSWRKTSLLALNILLSYLTPSLELTAETGWKSCWKALELLKCIHGTTFDKFPAFSYTMTYNLTGWPAAVVRGGTSPEGLPIGVQVVARPWRDDVALAVVQHIEKVQGGWQPPSL
jgi:Asp-tRNA(Asn)/Glu-tRNA(Gln) amidotransferase A subunit family amidase